MTQSLPSGPPSGGMKTFKVTVPQSTYNDLHRQAQGMGGAVKEYVRPLLIAAGNGEIKPRFEYADKPVAPVVAPAPRIADRIRGLRSLSGACKAVLTLVCETFEATGGDRTVDTNRELGQALHLSWRAVSTAVSLLETAGWLHVKQYANGANGRQLWPTELARDLYEGR